jgi:hypothetical protein
MDRSGSGIPYEVYCNRCGVTFPVGTRRCVHCGGPTSRQRGGRAEGPLRIELAELPGFEPEPGLEEEEVIPRRRVLSPIALLWVALAVSMTVYRACTGGAP